MEKNVEDILAELRAKKAAAEKAAEETASAAEETAALVNEAIEKAVEAEEKEEQPQQSEVSAPASPAAEPSPVDNREEAAAEEPEEEPEIEEKENKPASPFTDVNVVDRAVGDIYTASFTEKAYQADRSDRKRAARNRKALVDKESGRSSFFGNLFRLIGFLIIVALTILAVLIGLQFIADVEIIPVKAITEQVVIWFDGLMSKLGL